ncbi:MAG: DUF4214 domain-containing protein [Proteobacteria bacterium]|nr:DUF4214 domain-containing protein [Pseudomonadota bacterium]
MHSTLSSNDDAFVKSAYESILARSADPEGLADYVDRLRRGVPRFRVILDLLTSPEAKFGGADATAIEDILAFYKKSKQTTPKIILEYQLKNKYSSRILEFFYESLLKLRGARPRSPIGIAEDRPTVVASPDPADDQSYAGTLRKAEAHLQRLYAERANNPSADALADTLGIHVPRWVGVTNATKAFFPYTFPVPLTSDIAPEQLTENQLAAITDVLVDAKFSQLVFSGGDYFQYQIATAIKSRAPQKIIKVIWHGSPRQLGPHYELDPFLAWVNAARNGVCEAIGTVKPGMSRLFSALNVRCHFLQNFTTAAQPGERNDLRSDTVGMWLSHVDNYNKPAVPTLFALSLNKKHLLQGSGFGEDGIRLIHKLDISHKSISAYTIPHAEVLKGMRTSKLTVYITLSECMPMVPFESISEGTPCLVGPSTRLYDDPFLERNLLVQNPFDPVEISQKIDNALKKYDELREASISFLDRSRSRSKSNLLTFLE